MKRRVVSYEQVQLAVMKADGYDDFAEWKADLGDMYTSIYDLVPVENMWFNKMGGRTYLIEMPDGTPAIWYKY